MGHAYQRAFIKIRFRSFNFFKLFDFSILLIFFDYFKRISKTSLTLSDYSIVYDFPLFLF